MAIAEQDDLGADARVLLAARLDEATVLDLFADDIETVEEVGFDARNDAVVARRVTRLGVILLKEQPLPVPSPAKVREALLDAVRAKGVAILGWSPEAWALRERVNFLHRHASDGWPDLSDDALLQELESWLPPWLDSLRTVSDLSRVDMKAVLESLVGYERLPALDRLTPRHVGTPAGGRVEVDYAQDPPIVAVRLQELFGLEKHPAVLDGRVPLSLHLLSPARRPLQVTRDLPGFWRGSYAEVRKEMRGRYPKHDWPEDPLSAAPTRGARRR
jgi:ATP-dependent helicase HrpB